MPQDLRIKLVDYQDKLISRHNNWDAAERAAAKFGDCELIDWTGARLRYSEGKPLENPNQG